ncbi:MAG: F0F1 ATP synthase subunit B [Oscillospiraceae bacterium]|nr:F0F1 ATP synthase subunit B [Oscillospiraceae bacterium]
MTNDIVSFSVPDIVFTWLNLLVIFLIVKKFLFKPIKGIIEKRQKEVKDMYLRAEQAEKKAQNLEAQYTELLTKARLEAAEIVKNATEAAQSKADTIVEQAKVKAMELLEKTQAQIQREKDESLREAFNKVSDVVLITASKLIEKEMTMEDHKEIIEKILNDVKTEVR